MLEILICGSKIRIVNFQIFGVFVRQVVEAENTLV